MNRKQFISAGVFHKIPRIDDSLLAEIFAREVLAMLVRKELLSPEWAERILSWRHTGFDVCSRVRAKTKPKAERVGKYMLRPILALERLTFLEPEGKVDPFNQRVRDNFLIFSIENRDENLYEDDSRTWSDDEVLKKLEY